MSCSCRIDDDGLALTVCPEHAPAAWQFEYRVRQLLDAELDERIRELGEHRVRLPL